MKKVLLQFFLVMLPVVVAAYDAEIDGFYYNFDETNRTATVTFGLRDYSGEITIPSEVTYNGDNYSVTSLGYNAFACCYNLTSIIIPNSVTSIEPCAFEECLSLSSITIPKSVTSIGYLAFKGCCGLTSITIPYSTTSIGYGVFAECPNISTIIVDEENTVYDSRDNCNAIIEKVTNTLVAGCKNTSIPPSATSLGRYAFFGCSSLSSITIPNNITSIGECALNGCTGLSSITIPNSVTTIGNLAFRNCSGLTSITIPNSVTSIDYNAFQGCSGLTSITIPNSITSISNHTFSGCTSLTSVIIPNSVTSIMASAFAYCNNLKDFYCYAEEVPATEIANPFIDSSYKSATLHVPANAINDYMTRSPWSDFGTIVALTESTTVADVNLNTMMIHNNDHLLSIEGVEKGMAICIYDISGKLLSSTTAAADVTTIRTSLPTGSIVIVKIGDISVRVLLK